MANLIQTFCLFKVSLEILIKQKRKIMFDKIPPYKIQVFWNKNQSKSKILIVISISKIEKINNHFKKWLDLGLV